MSATDIHHYVVTFHYQEKNLSELLELSSTLINGGFSTTLHDQQGHPHELGTNSFGIISALPPEDIRQQAQGYGAQVLGQTPEVEVQSWQQFQQQKPG